MSIYEFINSGRSDLFAHLKKEAGVEAQLTTTFQDGFYRRQDNAALPLIVGSAAAIDPLALLMKNPRRKTLAPFFRAPGLHIAMAIEDDRRPGRVLDPLGCQDRRAMRHRVLVDLPGKT